VRVLDHQPWSWFLLEDGKRLLLDVNCTHSFYSYSFLLALDAAEEARWRAEGRGYLDWLAHEIHYSMPRAINTRSPYTARGLDGAASEAVHDAIMAWRAGDGQTGATLPSGPAP
jgi:hypothetical protein